MSCGISESIRAGHPALAWRRRLPCLPFPAVEGSAPACRWPGACPSTAGAGRYTSLRNRSTPFSAQSSFRFFSRVLLNVEWSGEACPQVQGRRIIYTQYSAESS